MPSIPFPYAAYKRRPAALNQPRIRTVHARPPAFRRPPCSRSRSSPPCGRGDPALGRHVEHPDFPPDAAWAFLIDQVAIGAPHPRGEDARPRTLGWLRDQLEFRADSVVVDSFTSHTAEGKRR